MDSSGVQALFCGATLVSRTVEGTFDIGDIIIYNWKKSLHILVSAPALNQISRRGIDGIDLSCFSPEKTEMKPVAFPRLPASRPRIQPPSSFSQTTRSPLDKTRYSEPYLARLDCCQLFLRKSFHCNVVVQTKCSFHSPVQDHKPKITITLTPP